MPQPPQPTLRVGIPFLVRRGVVCSFLIQRSALSSTPLIPFCMARHSRQQLIDYEELDHATDLTAAELATWEAARHATAHAYAPYSGFQVGAALLLADGTIFSGTNQENAAYPSGLCAERTALFGLAAAHPGHAPIVGMAVAARPRHGDFGPALPCGACRQVMLEVESRQGQGIELLLPGRTGTILRFPTLASLMPFNFSADDLPAF